MSLSIASYCSPKYFCKLAGFIYKYNFCTFKSVNSILVSPNLTSLFAVKDIVNTASSDFT